MSADAVADELVTWSNEKLAPWRQDALRRLALAGNLTSSDETDIIGLIKLDAGFSLTQPPPAPVPIKKDHFIGAGTAAGVRLRGIQDIQNINKLVSGAKLEFEPDGLTVIFGRNGSGKSGFVRILRSACRTRVENRASLEILSNVYGAAAGPKSANIAISTTGGTEVIPWKSDGEPLPTLAEIGVFDTLAAQLYVSDGSKIRYLPFGLALPHKLNEVCITLKSRLETEAAFIDGQLRFAAISFPVIRSTKAQVFSEGLSAATTDDAIQKAATFTEENAARLAAIGNLLSADKATSADLRGLATWARALGVHFKTAETGLSNDRLNAIASLRNEAASAKTAADQSALALFSAQPLEGIGGDTWRRLWEAARQFSTADAYRDQQFPVTDHTGDPAHCVLCLQELDADAAVRLTAFEGFVSGALSKAAEDAGRLVAQAVEGLPSAQFGSADEWESRMSQIAGRHEGLPETLTNFQANLSARLEAAKAPLLADTSKPAELPAVLQNPAPSLEALAADLEADADLRDASAKDEERLALQLEQAELQDLQTLAGAAPQVTTRRNLLVQKKQYEKAIAATNTSGITKRANELVDTYLTEEVINRFAAERKGFDLEHLKVSLTRESGRVGANFSTTTGATSVKAASILSEGEHRGLALAAFLTEASCTAGQGPIIVDDPVSSMDRERSGRVAARLAHEAKSRQVIIFTHDLVFFNELCHAADSADVPTRPITIWGDATGTGNIDPAGVPWMGLSCAKRIAKVKADFSPVRKLHGASPTDYDFQTKNMYGRLRDTYERMVEEFIFNNVVRRGVDRIETQKLRYVHLSDELAIRFHNGMSKCNTHSHDPNTQTSPAPKPDEFDADIAYIEALIQDLQAEHKLAEGRRPSMKGDGIPTAAKLGIA